MNLNTYIIENADKGGGASFVRNFGDSEVFFGIDETNEDLKDGPLIAAPGLQLPLFTANLEFGSMALFFTKKTDQRLPNRFGGMPLLKAAEMVCNLQGVDGMLIQSDQSAWFAVGKDSLKAILL